MLNYEFSPARRSGTNHHQPDRVPLDLGGSPVTGMHVSSVARLRQELGLDSRARRSR